MAIKQPALILERDRRKKKNESEATPKINKPTKEVVKNNKGTTHINRATISTKPGAQNNTQNRVLTNKERLTSKSSINTTNNDIRTIKTSKNKPSPRKSIQTVDVYERGGNYYYKDGKKEKQVDTKFVQNALNNNRSGVIGRYNSKGKLVETDENGNVKTFKGKTKAQIKEVGKQLKAWGSDIKQGKVGISNTITNAANTFDAVTELPGIKQAKIAKTTMDNALARWGHGAIKEGEALADFGLGKLGVDVSDDSTQRIENWLGYTPEIRDRAEENSLVRHDNTLGKITEGAGGLALDVMLGEAALGGASALGKTGKLGKLGKYIGNPEAFTSLEGLKGVDKAKAIGKNVLIDLGNKAIQQAPVTLASGGRAYEEADLAGATKKEREEYANKKMALTFAVSNIFNGVPGLKNDKGFLDRIASNTIGKPIAKITDKITNETLRKGADMVVKSIGKGTGEAIEENLEGILTAMLKNSTYSEGEKYTPQEAKEDAIVAFFLGQFFEVGNTKSEVDLESEARMRKAEIKKILADDVKIKTQLDNVMNRVLGRNGIEVNEETTIDDMRQQLQRSEAAKQIQANEVNQRVNSGEIDAQQGNALLEQVKNGTYQQNRNLEQIATQESQRLQQAAQQGIISQEQYTQGLQTLTNTVNQTREEINAPQQETTSNQQESTQESTFNNEQKQKQLDIIQNNNPMENDVNTGIRNIEDIKTLEETLQDSDWADYDEFNPDLTKKDIQNAIEKGTITVYSSYPIEQGVFVSPSKMEAESYLGDGKIYSQEVPIQDVAWIDPTQGQYAKVDNNVKTNEVENKSNDNREFLEGYPDDVINHWSNNDKEIVVKNYKQLDSLIDEALNNGEINNRLHLGRINESIVDKIRNMISNFPKKKQNYFSSNVYDIVLNQSEIRHLKEDKIKVTNEDIHDYVKKIPDIISKPDNVIYSDDGNNEGLRFEKKYSDGRYYSFTLVNDKKRTLQVKTSFMDKSDFEAKKRSMSLQSDATKAPNRTSETSKAFASYGDNIQQNNENVNNTPEILDKMPVEKSSTVQSLKKGIDTFRKEITDRFASVYDLSRKKRNPTLYHKVDQILGSDGLAQVDLGTNQVNLRGKPYKNFTDADGNKVTMSWEQAYDLYNEIPNKDKNEFLVHQLNIDRLNQGVDQFEIPLETSQKRIQELRSKYKNIDKWADNPYQFYRNLIQNMVDNGRIPQSLADKWLKETPHFVHIERQVNNKGNQGVSVKNGNIDSDNLFRKIKGGNYAILPIKETTAKYVQNARRAFAYNDFGKEYARTIGYDSQGNNVSEDIDIDEIFGLDPEYVNKDGQGNYTLKIYEKGTPIEIPISKEIYDSLGPQSIPRVPILSEATNVYKDLLTNKNPFFGFLRNPIKDAGDMFLYSKHPLYKSLGTYGKLFGGRTALRNRVITKDGVTAQDIVNFYHNTGNAAHSIYRNGQFETEKGAIRKGADKLLSPIEKGNDFMESMPRITEFWNTIESEGYTLKDGELVPRKGKTPKKSVDQVIAEANYNAADVTVNFKRGGRASKVISQNGGIFFNPSVQGASKFTRNISEAVGDAKAGDFQAAKRLVARAAMMGVAPAILSAVMYGGDDDYEEIQDYQKDQYYLIKGNDGKWIRIPKGRAISLFESAARRTIDKSKGKKDAFKGYGQLAINQIAPNNPLDNNIFSPITSAITNKSWSGNKIVSDSMAKRPVEEQFNEKTDELSKKLGKQLHISPMKINYVLDQYSGVLGDLILPQITPKSSTGSKNPIGNILRDNYSFDAANSNTSVGNFYDVKNKWNTKSKSVNTTEEDKLKSQFMNTQSQEMYKLYTKKQQIQMDKNLSSKEKYDQALEVQKEINKFAKKATKDIENTKIDKNTATVGNTLYYKDKKGEWHTESEKTTKNREKLGLSPEKYYYYKNEESYTPPGSEYSTSITSGKNAKYNIAMVDAFNFDPSDYLEYKYKLSKIRGDKDSSGKTIRYSARNKKLKYLNSLPISSVEKAYLMKQNDKYYKGSDRNLKNKINNSSLSEKQKKELYSYLGLGR